MILCFMYFPLPLPLRSSMLC
uniref:Uncharacterized protein n=1 Tax=Rhizophora mucronata TaxID=61149 RepID=A0A2P2NVU9_RHIMU